MVKKNFTNIQIGKKYFSRNKKEYTCIALNPYYDKRYPNDEYICVEKESGGVLYVSKAGNWRSSGKESRNDLVLELKEPVRRWVNIYRQDGGKYKLGRLLPGDKKQADSVISKNGVRVACVPIEFREGEGLEELDFS